MTLSVTLPFDLGFWAIAWLAVAFPVAAFIRGYTGFGFGALIVTAGAVVMNPLPLVAVAIFSDLAMTAQIWRSLRRDIDWRTVLVLFAGAAPALPLALWALTALSEDVARAVVAGFVMLLALALLMGWTLSRPAGTALRLGTGVFSGMANAGGLGGLPVVVLLSAQGTRPRRFRATLLAYFIFLGAWTLPVLWWNGLVTRDTLIVTALALPLFLVGNWLGSKRFMASEPTDFRRLVNLLLVLLASVGLVRALW
ncbi:MAG: sulfite exporter TauE/SafE family protein [Pararhodobacter sp.]|nr:sulfite exporter TauE/SafE family protein [Pararhodobacter sp.]